MPTKQPVVEDSSTTELRPRRREQYTLWVLASSGLIIMIGYWWSLGAQRGEWIKMEQAPPLRAKFLVDINHSGIPELIQLPGVGPALARRVLLERQQNGPFYQIDDLARVDGIGAKTLARIRPYLLPLSPSEKETVAESAQANTASDQ